jgi:hypothetical protein
MIPGQDDQPASGLVNTRNRVSERHTSSSASLDAEEQASNTSQLTSRMNIK